MLVTAFSVAVSMALSSAPSYGGRGGRGGHGGGHFGGGHAGGGHIGGPGGSVGHVGSVGRVGGVTHVGGVGRVSSVTHVGGIGRVGCVGTVTHVGGVGHFDPFYVHHGLHVGVIIGRPYYPVIYTAPIYVPYPPVVVVNRPPVYTPPPVAAGDHGLTVERVNGNTLRLTWQADGRAVQEVGLFLADAEQKVLAVQTLRAAPFTALFNIPPGVAFVGVSVVYADGVQSTTTIPYR